MKFNLIHFPFEYLPNQSGIEEVLEDIATDQMTYMWWCNYLQCIPVYAVMKDSEFIGFVTIEDKEVGKEIHLFILKPFRRYSIPLMRYLRETISGEVMTSVYSSHYFLLPMFVKAGGIITGEEKGFATRGDEILDITFLTFKEEPHNGI